MSPDRMIDVRTPGGEYLGCLLYRPPPRETALVLQYQEGLYAKPIELRFPFVEYGLQRAASSSILRVERTAIVVERGPTLALLAEQGYFQRLPQPMDPLLADEGEWIRDVSADLQRRG